MEKVKNKYRHPHPDRQARYITPEERERIYKCQIGDRYEKRNIALCRLGFTTGMRVSELCNLKISNCFDDHLVLLQHCAIHSNQTKGGYGARHFFLAKSTKKALIAYIEERKANDGISLDSPLFVSQTESKYHDKPFSPKGLVNVIKKIFLRAGVKNNASGKASSHSMRRTFATDVSRKYTQPKVIQVLLGHKSPYMSQQYITTNSEQLSEIVEDVFK